MKNEKRVLVFGTFDGVHDGHRVFLAWARSQGTHLTAVVARDSMALRLKGRNQKRRSEEERYKTLAASGLVDTVLLGDTECYSWNSIVSEHPNIIALGYDQQALHEALETYQAACGGTFDIVVCPHAYEPERLHSSLLK